MIPRIALVGHKNFGKTTLVEYLIVPERGQDLTSPSRSLGQNAVEF
jgi:molybdopterin-guanine dinucleotide biosynthesis protein